MSILFQYKFKNIDTKLIIKLMEGWEKVEGWEEGEGIQDNTSILHKIS